MTECYFTPNKKTTSATICANCGKEKMLHTIGEGINVNEVIIITDAQIAHQIEIREEEDFLTCESCGKKFDSEKEKYSVDADDNYFCEECWKELEPRLEKEYQELKSKGEID